MNRQKTEVRIVKTYRLCFKDDQERVALSMELEALMAQLLSGRAFSITYRLMIDGVPVFYNLRAVNAYARDVHHIVIGVSNAAAHVARQQAFQSSQQNSLTYAGIARRSQKTITASFGTNHG